MRNVFLLTAIIAATPLLLSPRAAHAQTSHGFRLPVYTRGSLTAGGRIWTIGAPEMVAASNVVDVLPSRDYKHLLIVRQTRALTPATKPTKPDYNAPGELTATWWNVKTRRSRELWRCDLKPGETGSLWCGRWFAKSGTVALSFIKGKDRRVLILSPAIGEAKEVVLPPTAYDLPSPSPTQNYVALLGADGACRKEIHFFDASGEIGDAIALFSAKTYFSGWSDDGTELLGFSPVKVEGGADDAYRNQWYAVNPAKRTVTPIPTPPLDANGYRIRPAETETDPADALPLRLAEDEAGTVRVEAFPKNATSAKESVLLSRDAQAAFLLPDGSAVFFWRDGALYAAPIVSVAKPLP